MGPIIIVHCCQLEAVHHRGDDCNVLQPLDQSQPKHAAVIFNLNSSKTSRANSFYRWSKRSHISEHMSETAE